MKMWDGAFWDGGGQRKAFLGIDEWIGREREVGLDLAVMPDSRLSSGQPGAISSLALPSALI